MRFDSAPGGATGLPSITLCTLDTSLTHLSRTASRAGSTQHHTHLRHSTDLLPEPTRTLEHAPATEAAAHEHGSAAGESAAPGLERQGSVSKMASVAKRMVTSPREEKEQVQLDKTLEREVNKGPKEADVGLMEV